MTGFQNFLSSTQKLEVISCFGEKSLNFPSNFVSFFNFSLIFSHLGTTVKSISTFTQVPLVLYSISSMFYLICLGFTNQFPNQFKINTFNHIMIYYCRLISLLHLFHVAAALMGHIDYTVKCTFTSYVYIMQDLYLKYFFNVCYWLLN